MNKLLLTLICCCLSVFTFAQNAPQPMVTIHGSVADSADSKAMGFVTVALQDPATKAGIKSGLTKDDGSFSLKAPSGKKYQLVLVFVGYKSKIVEVDGTGTDVNLGKLLLGAATGQLKEVAITAARPLMKQEVDRISYDVQADPESKALSALDMMRKVPLLTVDGNDAIQLKGSGNYKILINGKESALVAKNPSDILKSMPATNIEKIEVITTPPAKYDAEGLTGIINIITKKNADQGYNVGLNTRYNSIFGPGLNLNATVKEGKFGMSLFTGFGNQNKQMTRSGTTENIFSTNTNITQDGINRFGGNFHYGSAELSYEIDTLNLITSSVDLFGNDFTNNSDQLSTMDSQGIPQQIYNLNNNGTGSFTGFDLAVNYQLGFKSSKDRLLTFSYKYSYSPQNQFNDNLFSDRFNYTPQDHPDYQQNNKAGNKDHTLQLDYASPLSKKLSIEAGAKVILRNNYSNFHVDNRDLATNQYMTIDSLTNDFSYHQDISSVYNSYQLKLDKWSAKAGLRLEHTDLNADFTSAGAKAAPSYNNLIPSVSIQRSFKSSSLNFGFTQRIQRPGIFQLNPFINKSNPLFINTGNPGLKPELNNTFELNYSNFTKNSINIGLSYAFSNNSIQNVSNLQEENVNGKIDTITYTTFQNLGSNKTLGVSINTNLNFTPNFSFGMNGQVNHVWLKGTFGGHDYKNDGFSGHIFANSRYKFGTSGWAVGVNAGFFSGGITLQGTSGNFVFSQYVVSKEMLNKKLTLSFAANNPYSKYRNFSSTTNSAEFYQTSFNQNYYRTMMVRVNYRFGKLNSDIKKNQHGINNDDSKGGGGGNSGANQ